ncbi:MAG: copper-translocating P-type ATPase [Nitrospinae bacterium]|nr:copper-translocating P-type ATPase [Nitrospinota bacterium]
MNKAKKCILPVYGMKCSKCVAKVTQALEEVDGISDIEVSLEDNEALFFTSEDNEQLYEDALAKIKKAGFSDTPIIEKPEEKNNTRGNAVLELNVNGMSCASCVATVEKGINALSGVASAEVNLLVGSAKVSFDKDKINKNEIIQAINNLGYNATEKLSGDISQGAVEREKNLKKIKFKLAISATLLLFFLVISNIHVFSKEITPFIQFLIVIPIQFYCGLYFLKGAFGAIKHGATNMDTLVSLGTLTALIYSSLDMVGITHGGVYFETIAFLVTFILLGKFLEESAKNKTSDALTKLAGLQAKEATVKIHGEWVKKDIHDVKEKDIVKIYPGEKIPLDGIVVSGSSHVDESMISGEPIPVRREKGDKVIGSTMNKEGELQIEVTGLGNNSLLAKIINVVAEAQSGKAKAQKLADKISSIFVPVIIILGISTFIGWYFLLENGYLFPYEGNTNLSQAILNGISVWVIACPCALGLATPTVIMVVTGMGAKEGILIKNIQALENAGEIDTFIFDKTGTLTEGKPSLERVIALGNYEEAEILLKTASLEEHSNHPIALAITEKARNENIELLEVKGFKNIVGVGVEGKINNEHYRVVKPSDVSLEDSAKLHVEGHGREGKTVAVLARGKEVMGIIVIEDPLKKNAGEVLSHLSMQGKNTVLLTGDNRLTAEYIGKKVFVDRVIANVLPQEKSEHVHNIKNEGKKVAMIGDGINDAPALAVADISFAMSSGSDIAIESADITLLRNDLSLIPKTINLSKCAYLKMKQNLFWALFYNTAAIPMAMLGYLSPEIAAAAMALSSVTVVTNSLLLKNNSLE